MKRGTTASRQTGRSCQICGTFVVKEPSLEMCACRPVVCDRGNPSIRADVLVITRILRRTKLSGVRS